MARARKFILAAVLTGLAGIGWFQFHQNSAQSATATKQFSSAGSQKNAPLSGKDNFQSATESDDELLQRATNAIASSPELALAIALKLLNDDSDDENGRVAALIVALADARQFQTALELANEAPLDLRADLLNIAFTRWAQKNPEDAVKALDSIQDDDLRAQAFQSLANGWAANNPSALADFAASLPDGQDRAYALNKALDNWSLQDPAALAAWLDTVPPGLEFDQGVALLLAKSDEANRDSTAAITWVESIGNPDLRFDSLAHVVDQWAQTDPAAAQKYVAGAAWLNERQRTEILKNLSNPAN